MLWLILLHHLVRGRWVTVVRRIAEAMTRRVPDRSSSPASASSSRCSPATRTSTTGRTPTRTTRRSTRRCATSSAGCRPTFFAVRYVDLRRDLHRRSSAYFAKKSREQDETRRSRRSPSTLRIASGPAMILYAFATCIARVRHPDVDRAEVVLDDLRRQLLGQRVRRRRSRRSR